MPNCPNCGAAIHDGDAFCESCGATLNQERGAHQQDESGHSQQPEHDQQSGQQPPQGNQPRQGGNRGHGQPQGRQGQGGHQGHGSHQQNQQGQQGYQQHGRGRQQGVAGTDLSRRQALLGDGGLLAALGGGWFVFTNVLGGPSGPAGTVKAYVQALNNGNAEKANSHVAEDSPLQTSSGFMTGMTDAAELSVTSTEVVEQTESSAEVLATLEITVSAFDQTKTQTNEVRAFLEKRNGEWKIVEMR